MYRSKKYLLPLVELAVYPLPVWLAGVLEVGPGSGDDHLQEDVEDGVEGLAVPVSVGNTFVVKFADALTQYICSTNSSELWVVKKVKESYKIT